MYSTLAYQPSKYSTVVVSDVFLGFVCLPTRFGVHARLVQRWHARQKEVSHTVGSTLDSAPWECLAPQGESHPKEALRKRDKFKE